MNDVIKENSHRYQEVMKKFHTDSRNIAIDWANNILEDKEKYLVIDIIIASQKDPEIIKIEVSNIDDVKILDIMFKPQGSIDRHILTRIKDSGLNLADLPLWEDKISELKYLETKILLGEVWDYYRRAFDFTIMYYGRENLSFQGIDVGNIYNMYKGNWDNYKCEYRRQSIPNKITGGNGKCRDLIAAIELMANEDGV